MKFAKNKKIGVVGFFCGVTAVIFTNFSYPKYSPHAANGAAIAPDKLIELDNYGNLYALDVSSKLKKIGSDGQISDFLANDLSNASSFATTGINGQVLMSLSNQGLAKYENLPGLSSLPTPYQNLTAASISLGLYYYPGSCVVSASNELSCHIPALNKIVYHEPNIKSILYNKNRTCLVDTGDNVKCSGLHFEILRTSFGNPVFKNEFNTTFQKINLSEPIVSYSANSVAASEQLMHVCSVGRSGQVYCWGDNTKGQLGIDRIDAAGSRDFFKVETVTNVANALQVSTSDEMSCALMSNGHVKCWGGLNKLEVPNLSDARYIAVNNNRGCAIVAGDKVKCWTAFSTTGAKEIANFKVKSGKFFRPDVMDSKKLAALQIIENFGLE